MKGNTRFLSTKFFNFRLFLEALKRLRVVGIATAILSLTASALVPAVVWLDRTHYKAYDYTYTINTELLCVPAGLVVFLAPFFFFTLFSFLQKRKESDFFHSIPYTRTCVYVSFVAASLAFVWGIQLASGLTAGILWSFVPKLVFDMGGLVAFVFTSMLAAALLSAFMMLALSVSGTSGSCMLLFLLFASFTRVVAAIFLGCMQNIILIPANAMWDNSILSPLWFSPLAVLVYFVEFDLASKVLFSPANILYTIAVTVAVYALAGLIYKHRKSEMAGNPAPGTRTQTLFRVMFTLLPTLLIPLFLIRDADEPSLILVLVVGILLVYFLYELITTKRPKNMLKAVPSLGFVVAACLLFVGIFASYRCIVLYENVKVKDIRTVTVEAAGFDSYSYQGRLLQYYETNDPDIVKMVEEQLRYSQVCERLGYEYRDDYWNRTTVSIRMKDGRTLRRRIAMKDIELNHLGSLLREQTDMQALLYQLPSAEEVESANIDVAVSTRFSNVSYVEDKRAKEVLEIFRKEFEGLTAEQKDYIMAPTFYYYDWTIQDTGMTLTLRGQVDHLPFHSEYLITNDLPLTRAAMLKMWLEEEHNYYECQDTAWGGTSADVLEQVIDSMADTDYMGIYKRVNVTLHASPVSRNANEAWNSYANELIRVKTEQIPALFTLLLEHDLTNQEGRGKPSAENISITENTYIIHMRLEGDVQQESRLYMDLNGLFDLTEEDWQEIFDLLGARNTWESVFSKK